MAAPAGSTNIPETIRKYHGDREKNADQRYRSWEHCYEYFRRTTPAGLAAQRDEAALQLGFFLASWGMYRGSAFLLQYAYTAHRGVIDRLADPEFLPLWWTEFGSDDGDSELIPLIDSAVGAIRDAYAPFGEATDTLVTKVILGTFGCLPACDEYFRIGFKKCGFQYSYLNSAFIRRVRQFCSDNVTVLRAEQRYIKERSGVHYPLMKLIDMYFWQTGYDEASARKSANGRAEEGGDGA